MTTQTRILLLEDDQEDVYLMTRRLRACLPQDYVLKHADNYEAAKPLLASVDLLLLDLHLPDKSGISLVHCLLSEFPGLPIVIITGQDDVSLAKEAIRDGVQDYLLKDQLSNYAIGNVIEFALERNKLTKELKRVNKELTTSLAHIEQLHGLLPICACCKKIRNDENSWEEVESYVARRTEVSFTHGICPDCFEKSMEDLDQNYPARPRHSRAK